MMLRTYYNNNLLELYDLFEDGGFLVRCWPDGRIELYKVPQYGGEERFHGYFPTINAAIEVGKSWT